uniref:PiggyBac transposable element-derived protein domain-containing protein n=1 Tax=Sphaeramia orbicularis TaxID=375764 RepID=A0A673BR56_9TELE
MSSDDDSDFDSQSSDYDSDDSSSNSSSGSSSEEDAGEWETIEVPEQDPPHHPYVFTEHPGPVNPPPRDSTPIVYFMMFFTLDLLQHFVDQTNRYAEQYPASHNLRPRSRAHQWIPATVTEMKGFIALILNMGIVQLPSIFMYWSTEASIQQTFFRRVFRCNRFQLLLKFFHVEDNLQEHYLPREYLAIDESMIGSRGRFCYRQFMPNKRHARFGVKLWLLVESASKYCMQFFVYCGRRYDPAPPEGQGYDVVIRLLRVSNLLNRSYHVVVDSFFCSHRLASALFAFGTYLTGTIRKNRDIPAAAKVAKPPVGRSTYWRNGQSLLVAFREKASKVVRVLSTCAEARNVNNKPMVIADIYNPHMCGVDVHDQQLYVYHDERKTVKVWKKATFNILSRMLLNAYQIYIQNTDDPNPLSQRRFNSSVIEALAADHLRAQVVHENAEPLRDGRAAENVQAGVRLLPDRKETECVVCSHKNGNGRKRSRTVCVVCERGVHVSCEKRHTHN